MLNPDIEGLPDPKPEDEGCRESLEDEDDEPPVDSHT
jgi:hypothetical protein